MTKRGENHRLPGNLIFTRAYDKSTLNILTEKEKERERERERERAASRSVPLSMIYRDVFFRENGRESSCSSKFE
jgi:hypothetical protein